MHQFYLIARMILQRSWLSFLLAILLGLVSVFLWFLRPRFPILRKLLVAGQRHPKRG